MITMSFADWLYVKKHYLENGSMWNLSKPCWMSKSDWGNKADLSGVLPDAE